MTEIKTEVVRLEAEEGEYIMKSGASMNTGNLSRTVYLAAGQKASDYTAVKMTQAEYDAMRAKEEADEIASAK